MTDRLASHHREMLHASGITDDLIAARGYFTANKKVELANLGFAASQQIVPALVIPVVFASAGYGTWLAYLFATLALLLLSLNINVFASRSASPGALYAFAGQGDVGQTAAATVLLELLRDRRGRRQGRQQLNEIRTVPNPQQYLSHLVTAQNVLSMDLRKPHSAIGGNMGVQFSGVHGYGDVIDELEPGNGADFVCCCDARHFVRLLLVRHLRSFPCRPEARLTRPPPQRFRSRCRCCRPAAAHRSPWATRGQLLCVTTARRRGVLIDSDCHAPSISDFILTLADRAADAEWTKRKQKPLLPQAAGHRRPCCTRGGRSSG